MLAMVKDPPRLDVPLTPIPVPATTPMLLFCNDELGIFVTLMPLMLVSPEPLPVNTPFLSIEAFSLGVPEVGPNWKLRPPSVRACNCAVCGVVPSVEFNCNELEACAPDPVFGASVCVPVKVFPPARLALPAKLVLMVATCPSV